VIVGVVEMVSALDLLPSTSGVPRCAEIRRGLSHRDGKWRKLLEVTTAIGAPFQCGRVVIVPDTLDPRRTDVVSDRRRRQKS
jgi:hypothetical protein